MLRAQLRFARSLLEQPLARDRSEIATRGCSSKLALRCPINTGSIEAGCHASAAASSASSRRSRLPRTVSLKRSRNRATVVATLTAAVGQAPARPREARCPGGGEPGHVRADLGEDHIGAGQAEAGISSSRATASANGAAPDPFADGEGRGIFSPFPTSMRTRLPSSFSMACRGWIAGQTNIWNGQPSLMWPHVGRRWLPTWLPRGLDCGRRRRWPGRRRSDQGS